MHSIIQLQLFEAVYTYRNVSQAASSLGISQPTASEWLGKLRKHFKDDLFIRSDGTMNPTSRCDELIEPVRTAIEAFQVLESSSSTFIPEESTRTFRIQCTDGNHLTLLPTLYTKMSDASPNSKLKAFSLSDSPGQALRTNEVDLVLSTRNTELQREFRFLNFRSQTWVCLRGESLIPQTIDIHGFTKAQHLFISGSGWSNLVATVLKDLEISSIPLEIPGVLGLPDILRSNPLIATVPARIGGILARFNGIQADPCPVRIPPLIASMYWQHRNDHDKGQQWFRDLVASSFMS